jgi:thioredoxin 2
MAILDHSGIIVACPSCGKNNRLGYAHVDRPHRCASCKTPLAPPAEPLEVPGAAVFDAIVSTASVPVVVDFWAPWCGPCRAVAPEFEKVARSRSGQLLVLKVNTDVLTDLGARYSIRSIPTMMVFSKGRETGRTAGARPASGILAFVDESLVAA